MKSSILIPKVHNQIIQHLRMREISDLTHDVYPIAYYVGKRVKFNGEIYYSLISVDPFMLSPIQI